MRRAFLMLALGVLPGCPLLKACGVANLYLWAPQVLTTADGLVACWRAQYVLDRRSELRCAHRGADGGWQRELALQQSESVSFFPRAAAGSFGFEELGAFTRSVKVVRRAGDRWTTETALDVPSGEERFQFWLYGPPQRPRLLAYSVDTRRWLARQRVEGQWQDDSQPTPPPSTSSPVVVLEDESGQRTVWLGDAPQPFSALVERDGWRQVDTAWLPRPTFVASATLGGIHHAFMTAPAGTLRFGRIEAGQYRELAAVPEQLQVACATATAERLHVVLASFDGEGSGTVLLDFGRDGTLLGRTVVAEDGWAGGACVAPLGTGDDLVVGFGPTFGQGVPVRVRSRIGGKWSEAEVLDAEVDP